MFDIIYARFYSYYIRVIIFNIALKDPDETYLLNGEFMITMFPKKIEYHGISMDYSGSNSVTEYVNSSQILPKDLFLQVANKIFFTYFQ